MNNNNTQRYYNHYSNYPARPINGQYYPTGYHQINPTENIKKIEKSKLRRKCNGIGFYIIAYYMVLQLTARFILYIVYPAFGIDSNMADSLCDITYSVLSALVPGVIYIAVSDYQLSDGFSKTFVNPTILIPLALMGMGVSRVANYAADLFDSNISVFGLENSVSMSSDVTRTVPEIILYVISVAVIPAFAEEFAFRGIVMGSLKKYGRAFAIVTSSILFGAMHGNTTQIVFAFILGLIFGYADCVTNSIVPSIIIHFLNNFCSALIDVLQSNTNIDEQTLYSVYMGIMILFCVSGFISFIYLAQRDKNIFKLSDREAPDYRYAGLLSYKEKINAFFVNPGVIIALSLFFSEMVLLLIPINDAVS